MIDLAVVEKERQVDEVKLFSVLDLWGHCLDQREILLTVDLFVSPPSFSSVVRLEGRGRREASPAAGVALATFHTRQDGRGTEVPAKDSPLRSPEPNCGCVFAARF